MYIPIYMFSEYHCWWTLQDVDFGLQEILFYPDLTVHSNPGSVKLVV